MGEASGTYGGKATFIEGFGGKTYGKHRLEKPRIEERIILKWTLKNCVDLAQDADRRRTLVNAVMKFRVPKKGEIFLTN
jgi:hypothetical protein